MSAQAEIVKLKLLRIFFPEDPEYRLEHLNAWMAGEAEELVLTLSGSDRNEVLSWLKDVIEGNAADADLMGEVVAFMRDGETPAQAVERMPPELRERFRELARREWWGQVFFPSRKERPNS